MVEVKESDLKIDTLRAGVSGSVRITHIPTGFVEEDDFSRNYNEIRKKVRDRIEARIKQAEGRED